MNKLVIVDRIPIMLTLIIQTILLQSSWMGVGRWVGHLKSMLVCGHPLRDFLLNPSRHNTLLLTKKVSLHINYMLRQYFLFAPSFV